MARILIGDDDKFCQSFYRSTIDFMGHEPVVCSNGAEVVAEFRENGADLIILDLMMPVMDGIEACRQIRALPGGAGVPIIMASGMDDEEDIVRGLNAGANEYLIKPVREPHLLAKLKVFLRMSSLHRNDFDLARNHIVFADKYRIVKMLGYGTHSIVFLAEMVQEQDRKIALKLFKDTPDILGIFESFAATAGKLSRINSPNVLKLHDFGQCDRRLFAAMEYAPGGDISRIIKKRTLSQLEAVKIGLDISLAIRDIGAQDIIHFDIKPENIMVSEGKYLLGDFGIITTRTSTTIPVGREIWGTLAYMPPEYFLEDKMLVGKSDIYSLGVTLYQGLTGENPFYSEKPGTVMFCLLNLAPPDIVTLNEYFDKRLSSLIARMMIKNPEERPGTEEVAAEFGELAAIFEKDFYKARPLQIFRSREFTKDELLENYVAETPVEQGRPLPGKRKRRARRWKLGSNKIFSFLYFDLSSLLEITKIAALYLFVATLVIGGIFILAKLGRYASSSYYRYDDYQPGTLSVLKCLDCGFLEEKKITDVTSDKCSRCSGGQAVAYKCSKCKFIFPPIAREGETGKLEEFICPNCGSHDTDPVMSSVEYLIQLEIDSRNAKKKFKQK